MVAAPPQASALQAVRVPQQHVQEEQPGPKNDSFSASDHPLSVKLWNPSSSLELEGTNSCVCLEDGAQGSAHANEFKKMSKGLSS